MAEPRRPKDFPAVTGLPAADLGLLADGDVSGTRFLEAYQVVLRGLIDTGDLIGSPATGYKIPIVIGDTVFLAPGSTVGGGSGTPGGGGSGATPVELEQAVARAETAADASESYRNLAQNWASLVGEFSDQPIEGTLLSARAYAIKAEEASIQAFEAQTVVQDVQAAVGTSVASAQASAAEAAAWASANSDVVLGGGLRSARAYAEQAQIIANNAPAILVKIVTDADIVAGSYSLQSSDLFKIVRFRNTVALNVVVPANLWASAAGQTGWIRLRREGAEITVGSGAAAGAAPTLVRMRRFGRRYRTLPTTGVTQAYPLAMDAVAANGRLLLAISSYFNLEDLDRVVGATLTGFTLNPLFTDTYTGNTAGIRVDVWEAVLGAIGATTADLTLSIPKSINVFTAKSLQLSNCAGFEGFVKTASVTGNNTGLTISQVTSGANRRAFVFGVQRGFEGGASCAPGALVESFSTVGYDEAGADTNSVLNQSIVVAEDSRPAAGSKSYRTDFLASRISLAYGIAAVPSAGAAVPFTLTGPGTTPRLVIDEPNYTCSLILAPDGSSGWLEDL